jgi:hypothetical protein
MEELTDCYESGFRHDSQTIYLGQQVTNQFRGIRDVDLAVRLGAFLGVDVDQLQAHAATRAHFVRLIQQAVEEE